jgi:hypothetical protein
LNLLIDLIRSALESQHLPEILMALVCLSALAVVALALAKLLP